ncbi:MAG: DUF6089 family protein [Crocinitomicaceae bacterium]
MIKLKYQFFFLFIFGSVQLFGQSNNFKKAFEVGVFGGGAYYIGDLNPTKHFVYSEPAYGAVVRFNLSKRHSFRLTGTYATISANDANSADPWQVNRNLNFQSTLFEVAAGFEVCLLPYAINDLKNRFTPYFFYELAWLRMNPTTANVNGNEVVLNDFGTEGQGSTLSDQRNYFLNQFTVPLGVGIKFNIVKRVALSFEYGIRLTFTDYLDDVSGNYINQADLANLRGPLAASIADPSLNNISSVPSANRGNPNNKDWYSFYGAMLTIKPWKYNVCNMFQQ